MSKLKRINPMRKKKKEKEPKVKFRNICEEQLQLERNKIKEKDDDKIEKLLKDKILKKDGSYKHVQNIAKNLEWSTSRVFRSLERLARYDAIQEMIKKRVQVQMKKAGIKEKQNEKNTKKQNIQDTQSSQDTQN